MTSLRINGRCTHSNVRYQFTSDRKPSQGRKHTGARTLDTDTSDYGTMSRGDQDMECGRLTEGVAGLHLEEEVTIDERRERIHSVLDEILSVPRLADANLTQRKLSNPGQLKS